MKKIAALTMVRNDDFYLRKWVAYYSRELGGKEHLYIYFDGLDQTIAPFCEGTHAVAVPKIGTQVVSAEKGRLKFLSEKAAELMAQGYDLVIGVDADEFVVVDPKLGLTLAEYLSSLRIRGSVSGLGLDFGQKRPTSRTTLPSFGSATTPNWARATPSPPSWRRPIPGAAAFTGSRAITSI